MADHQESYHLHPVRGSHGDPSSSRGSSSLRESPKPEALPQQATPQEPRRSNHTQRTSESEDQVEVLDGDRAANDEGRTSLSQTLGERHVNMMTFSCVIGIGMFLQNGRIINLAGPGMAWVIYPIVGSIMWSVQASLGEMTALFPVAGALFELPCRYLDRSIGYAVGWMSWFAWTVIIAAELQAVAGLFQFKFDDETLQRLEYPEDTLEWSTASDSPAVWVSVFLPALLVVNLVRVRWYGELEYVIGVLKMLFIVGLILFNMGINIQTGTHFRYYRDPWGFISRSWISQTGAVHTDGWAHLASVWTAMTLTIFSMIGFETVTVTAAENRELYTFEGVKISSRKIALRIILLYTLMTFTVGLNIPYDEPQLSSKTISALDNGTHSAFILAAVRAGKTFWPKFMNAFFILSATSSGMNSLYLSSRLLHSLALTDEVWPKWSLSKKAQQWLKETGSKGVPRNAIIISWAFAFLAYLAAGNTPARQLGRLALNSTVSMLIVYAVICVTFLRFKAIIALAATGIFPTAGGTTDPEPNVQAYSRRKTTRSYPYRSNWQPLRAYYALFGCTLMIVFNGWRSITPFSAADFVASYISVFVFIALCVGYRWHLHHEFSFQLHPTLNLRHPVMADVNHRHYGRDKLRFQVGEGEAPLKFRARVWKTLEWIWVWLK